MAEHNDFGEKAEQMAADHLLSQGYEILERNYRFGKAEVDIIALKNDCLAAVEVKARSSTYFGEPQSFVSKKKIRLLVKAVDHYVVKNDLDVEVRFDIITVLRINKMHEIKHIEDAFYHF
ncbi:YraN family protein [Galbibacter sp. EGI 63066]|uniref:YraN family protein n=1 Tax=Galbibacter sp. EGI 63066 TaxID=2993559 RepID=UPI002248B94F|nr:YraN family protein [Galbibacter sp. EGI 63066]MCX2680926.1 YraN family protein [Galbibacter sp. EGI 63066]